MTINWKKTIIGVLDVAIAVYLVAAVTVLNKPYGKAAVCSEVNITTACIPAGATYAVYRHASYGGGAL